MRSPQRRRPRRGASAPRRSTPVSAGNAPQQSAKPQSVWKAEPRGCTPGTSTAPTRRRRAGPSPRRRRPRSRSRPRPRGHRRRSPTSAAAGISVRERPALQLVERVCGDAHREEEREQRRTAAGRGGSAARALRRPRRTRDARACTAGAAASRSRATPPARAARTHARPLTSSVRPHVTTRRRGSARFARTSSMPASRQACRSRGSGHSCVVPLDRRSEEGADLVPAVADQAARGRQADARPQLPQRAPDAARHAELEPGDRCRPASRPAPARAASPVDRRRSGAGR